jgi:ankyrin repeat protein
MSDFITQRNIETSKSIIKADILALRWAAGNGHKGVCRLLIEHGADIHAKHDGALRWAAGNGHKGVCRLLIEHGADIHANDDCALRGAAEYGNEGVCRLLIEHGADINADDDYALIWAARNGHEDVCRFLLELDPSMAKHISPDYCENILQVFQAYGDPEAIQKTLSERSFTDNELDYIASCFVHRKLAN